MKKKLSLLLVISMLIGLLSGCAATAESVAGKMAEAMTGKVTTKLSFEAPMYIKVIGDGESEKIDLQLSGTYWYSDEPVALYGEIKYEGDIMGQWLSDRLELYLRGEDGKYMMYIYSKLADTWMRTEVEVTEEELEEDVLSFLTAEELDLTKLVLEEETQTIGDSEVYVLSYTFDGQMIQKAFDEQGGFSGMLDKAMDTEDMDEETAALLEQIDFTALDNLDFTVLEMPVTMHIDKESYEVKQLEISYIGLQTIMEQMMEGLLEAATTLAGEEIKSELTAEDMRIDLPDMFVKVTDITYEDVEVKDVPERAIVVCDQQEFEAKQDNGTYIIQELGEAVCVAPHWTLRVTDYGYNFVQVEDDYDNKRVIYTMLDDDWNEKDIINYVKEEAEYWEEEDYKVEITESTIGDFTLRSIHLNTAYHLHYAYKQVGDRLLLVEAYNFITLAQEQFLNDMLNCVSEYQLP